MTFASVTQFCRIGEAANPGPREAPECTIGTINPTGALGKAEELCALTPGVWGITESHLTSLGCDRFKKELKFQGFNGQFIPGFPVEPVSKTPGTIGGKASGVGILTTHPTRMLTNDWPQETWETSRIQAVASLIHHHWIHIGVAYGYSHNASTKEGRDRTDGLLKHLTNRIVHQASGFRVIMGDLNQLDNQVEQIKIWKDHGFADLQQLALQRWQQPIQATCKRSTTKDFIFISKELQPYLQRVWVDPDCFADHATVEGTFTLPGPPRPFDLWVKPMPLPWDDMDHDQLAKNTVAIDDADPDPVHAIFHAMEQSFDKALSHMGKQPLSQGHFGRSTQVSTTRCQHHPAPVRRSPPHEYQIQYHGCNWKHAKWCSQLRRLSSYLKLISHPESGGRLQADVVMLWKKIKGAPGFPGGFPHTWMMHLHKPLGAPGILPKQPPDVEMATAIYAAFRGEFQALEQGLNAKRNEAARARRLANPNVIYQDVAKQRSLPVQTVVAEHKLTVTDVSEDRTLITVGPEANFLPEPVLHRHTLLQVQHTCDHTITVDPHHEVEVGEILLQQEFVGNTHQLFQQFRALWEPMWNKHSQLPMQAWETSIDNIKQLVPIPSVPCQFPPSRNSSGIKWSKVRKDIVQ